MDQHSLPLPGGGWLWPSKDKWKVVTGWHREFNQYWRDDSNSSKFLDNFPYLLPLGVGEGNDLDLPYFLSIKTRDQILVTEAYDRLFHHLLLLRTRDRGSQRGAVITGQPGVGPSL